MVKQAKDISDVDLQICWEGKPSGLIQQFLTSIHLNFTTYQITKDELIVKTGFFRRKTNTVELYLLKDHDIMESIYQRILGIGPIEVRVDSHTEIPNRNSRIYLRNIKNVQEVRKLLRDGIEADVMERKITYFDKV